MDIVCSIYDYLVNNIELIVLTVTVIVLCWTGRAVWSTYWLQATPNLSFTLEQLDPDNPLHLHFHLWNDSRKDVNALVVAKIYTDDPQNPISLNDPFYAGKGAWVILSRQHPRGHKDLRPFLISDDSKKPIQFTIEVKICYREWSRLKRRTIGKVYTVPVQKWNYSKRGLIPVITDDEIPDFKCPE